MQEFAQLFRQRQATEVERLSAARREAFQRRARKTLRPAEGERAMNERAGSVQEGRDELFALEKLACIPERQAVEIAEATDKHASRCRAKCAPTRPANASILPRRGPGHDLQQRAAQAPHVRLGTEAAGKDDFGSHVQRGRAVV